MPRVSTDDLSVAVEWLHAYEPAPGEDGSPFVRVAAWIENEIQRRDAAAVCRQIAAQTGRSLKEARAALRRAQST